MKLEELRQSGHAPEPRRVGGHRRGPWRPRCQCGWESNSNVSKAQTASYHNDHLRKIREGG